MMEIVRFFSSLRHLVAVFRGVSSLMTSGIRIMFSSVRLGRLSPQPLDYIFLVVTAACCSHKRSIMSKELFHLPETS